MARIAVIGSGAVGSFYGALLARHGHDVSFLMRRDLDAVRAKGLDIRSKDGDFRLEDVNAVASPEEIGPADWVVCALKATALDEAESLLRPCVGEGTRIIALMNGLGIEERIAAWFGRERVFGGMAFVCLNRGKPGVVHHIDYGRVSIGHLGDEPSETELLHELLAPAGIEAVVAPNLVFARWEKLGWNIPFSALTVACGGIGTARILEDASLKAIAEGAIHEVAEAGNADLAARGSEARIDGPGLAERMFAQTATMGDYRPSMVIDYVLGRPMEVEAILGAPLRRAGELGVATPTIASLYGIVRAAQQRNAGEIMPLTPETVVPRG
ncbi:MAG: 2-dehydropantoate 2-reductase [Dehalococcoidia bacterium]|nr:2-dehydropantoate 2-reductase [Dehalococcoidia bacterium]